MDDLTAKQKTYMNRLTNRVKVGDLFQALIDSTQVTADPATPVNAINATKSLAVTGVVVDGETITINNPAVTGTDVYEFLADVAQTKTAPTNIAVNIEASTAHATGTLTIPTQPTSGDTMTIGAKVFTFVPNGTDTADGEVSVGTNLASAKLAIVAAINGTSTFNTPHPLVSASTFAGNVCTLTALAGGVGGNTIATTETFTAVGNVFAGVTLTGGTDCSAANAITALVSAVTASDTQGVGAADGAGDTVDFTADTAGAAGNAITLAETMTNGAFAGGATALSGGVNGTVGTTREVKVDASYMYVLVADNTVSGKNWRRVTLGSAY